MADQYDLSDLGATPYDLSDLGATPVSRESEEKSFLNGIPRNLLVGFGDAYRRNLIDLANIIPGINISDKPYGGEGLSYDIGQAAGEIASFISGGGLGNLALKGAKAFPIFKKSIGALEKGVGPALKRMLGTAAYGAITNPEERGIAALKGAGISAVTDALLPGLGKVSGKVLESMQPQKHAEKLLNILGNGQGLEENAKSLAQDIATSFKKQKEYGNALYNPVFNTLSDSRIISKIAPETSNYENSSEDFIKYYGRDIKKLHNLYEKNPTLKNAHKLQIDLGRENRRLEVKDELHLLSETDRDKLDAYTEAREFLINDINSFLNSENPGLAKQYEHATQNWLENVVPYLQDKNIIKIASKQKINPRSISTIFKNPEPHILKIVEDLGYDAKNKILYSELGKVSRNLTADKLANEFSKLDQKGLSSYLTPEVEDQFDLLLSKIGKRNIAQRGAGFLLGGSLAHKLIRGNPWGELGGALGASLIWPSVSRGTQKRIPLKTLENISKGVKKSYKPATTAIKAVVLPDKRQRMKLNLPEEEE